MKTIFFAFSALVAVALAKAPLTRRDTQDGVPNNYIVVLKKGLDPAVVNNHMGFVAVTSGQAHGGHRGFVKTYGIGAFNGYHIECDEEKLDAIRDHELVSPAAFCAASNPGEQALTRG